MPQTRAVLVAYSRDTEIRLPISGGAARTLILQLFAADPDVRAVVRLFRCDPALLGWTLHHTGDELTLDAMARWLVSEAGQERLTASARTIDVDNVTQARIAELARRSIAAGSLRNTSSDRDMILALLHNGRSWVSIISDVPQDDGWIGSTWIERLAAHHDRLVDRVAELELDEAQRARFDEIWQAEPVWHTAFVSACRVLHERRELQADFEQRLEQEKLRSMKELAYGASHEINNPLANIATRAQTLIAGEIDPQRRRTLATINDQAFRAHEMIADMMLFAKPPQLELSHVDLGLLLEQLIQGLEQRSQEHRVRVILDIAEPLSVEADEAQLLVALRAVCVNALEAMPGGGRVTIGLRPARSRRVAEPHSVNAAGYVEISIRDSGPGIPGPIRRHLFDPFFSGREAGRGLGFGLSKAWRIISELGGEIAVAAPPTGGTEFVVTLPVRQSAAPASNTK